MTGDFRVGVASRFHVVPGWADRLSVNGGCERVDGRLVAMADWRPPTADELARLTRPDRYDAAVNLFNVPAHLLADWAAVIGRIDDPAAFPGFARNVVDFLRFKAVPVPPACGCDAVVTAPGRATTRGGLGPSATVGLLNLGDEPTGVVVLAPPGPTAETFSTQSLVKIRLGRGEGCWLPAAGTVTDVWTVGQTGPGVVLHFRAEAGPAP